MKIISIILLLLSINCYSQTCTVKGIDDWEQVEIRLMEKPNEYRNKYKLIGEGKIIASDTVTTIAGINPTEIKKVKETAAKYKSCLVFVDLKDLHASEKFPVRKKGKLYYYFVIQHSETEAEALINKVADSLSANSGAFCELAKEYSEDNDSKYKCGEITFTKQSPVPAEFEPIIKGLKEGEISKPFKSAYGHHIIYLVKKANKNTTVKHILVTFQ